ncbi:MAG: enoyl-CoA hydratase-related protein [Acidimicrobiia bacterium]
MTEQLVVVSKDGSVGTVRLNEPDSLNALSVPMANAFKDALIELGEDASIRALVVTGTGRGFCAGGDVQSFYDHRDDPTEVMGEVLDGLHGAVQVLMDLPFPTIAAINGTVAGAGMGVALATDLAIASEAAVFTMAYTGIGVSPDGSSTFWLPRMVGTRFAMEMILTNRRLSADEAVTLGLVNAAVPDAEFSGAVEALATKLAAGPTRAFVRARELIRSSFGNTPVQQMADEAASILAAGSTKDFYEGVTAFIEKRRPDFVGS